LQAISDASHLVAGTSKSALASELVIRTRSQEKKGEEQEEKEVEVKEVRSRVRSKGKGRAKVKKVDSDAEGGADEGSAVERELQLEEVRTEIRRMQARIRIHQMLLKALKEEERELM
jgi:hypothetical protein